MNTPGQSAITPGPVDRDLAELPGRVAGTCRAGGREFAFLDIHIKPIFP